MRTPQRVEIALRALVDKLETLQPAIDNAFLLATIHGVSYTGPTYVEEVKEARAALAQFRREGGWPGD